MHISEGILSGSVLLAGWAGTGALTAVGLKKSEPSKIVRTALISSAFFLASLVNVRIGPGSTHLSLLAPMGLVLGWGVFPAVLVALLLQALLFQFGGVLVLGVNTFVMAGAGLCVYLMFGRVIRESPGRVLVGGLSFLAGALAVMTGAGLAGLCLFVSDEGFANAAKLLVSVHIPLALIEGLVTMFLMLWIKKSASEFLS